MNVVLDIELNGELKENDMIVFKNGKWKVVSKESFISKYLVDQKKVNDRLEKKINELEENLLKLAKIVKEK